MEKVTRARQHATQKDVAHSKNATEKN